jgi:hypothetical protein
MRLRLRVMVAAFNHVVADYTLARLEITSAHPRMTAPPVIDRLGLHARPDDAGHVWRVAIRQLRAAERYVKTGASAVARRHEAWSALTEAFAQLMRYASGIETLRTTTARARRRPRS